ncbi:hypothetical protein EV714DRAFT_250367 [Schizophyllum commune]
MGVSVREGMRIGVSGHEDGWGRGLALYWTSLLRGDHEAFVVLFHRRLVLEAHVLGLLLVVFAVRRQYQRGSRRLVLELVLADIARRQAAAAPAPRGRPRVVIIVVLVVDPRAVLLLHDILEVLARVVEARRRNIRVVVPGLLPPPPAPHNGRLLAPPRRRHRRDGAQHVREEVEPRAASL